LDTLQTTNTSTRWTSFGDITTFAFERDEHKAAFITPRGLFEPTVMYFGLCNSPGTFMRMMQTIFRECLRRRLCVIYMDDIICMGKTKEELKHNTIEVLKILEEHDLYIKDTKCYWK